MQTQTLSPGAAGEEAPVFLFVSMRDTVLASWEGAATSNGEEEKAKAKDAICWIISWEASYQHLDTVRFQGC